MTTESLCQQQPRHLLANATSALRAACVMAGTAFEIIVLGRVEIADEETGLRRER